MSRLEELAGALRENFPECADYQELGMDVLVLAPGDVHAAITWLRDTGGFAMLSDLSAVDLLPRDPRFDVNYHFYDLERDYRLRVKVSTDRELPSVTSIYPTADWQEREIWDMFGIGFTGHPNLKRLLMPDDWEGHPLRKDYPIGGVPVEYRVEPAYVGALDVSERGRPAMGGPPARLVRDRGRKSRWTWTGPPVRSKDEHDN